MQYLVGSIMLEVPKLRLRSETARVEGYRRIQELSGQLLQDIVLVSGAS